MALNCPSIDVLALSQWRVWHLNSHVRHAHAVASLLVSCRRRAISTVIVGWSLSWNGKLTESLENLRRSSLCRRIPPRCIDTSMTHLLIVSRERTLYASGPLMARGWTPCCT
jgi:hypothetical protein